MGELDFDRPYPPAVLERLVELVPCDAVTYQEADLHAKRFQVVMGIGPDGDSDRDIDRDIDDEQLYWAVGPCPISDYRERTGDLSAVRMSDVVSQRRYREMPIFREYLRPAGLEQMIDVGLPTAPQCHRSFILFCEESGRDFSERDRAVLDAVQPHFSRFEQVAALRHQLAERARAQDSSAEPRPSMQLTTRERQIVELVAEGKTNAQIALELWVAPSTVKEAPGKRLRKAGRGQAGSSSDVGGYQPLTSDEISGPVLDTGAVSAPTNRSPPMRARGTFHEQECPWVVVGSGDARPLHRQARRTCRPRVHAPGRSTRADADGCACDRRTGKRQEPAAQ